MSVRVFVCVIRLCSIRIKKKEYSLKKKLCGTEDLLVARLCFGAVPRGECSSTECYEQQSALPHSSKHAGVVSRAFPPLKDYRLGVALYNKAKVSSLHGK